MAPAVSLVKPVLRGCQKQSKQNVFAACKHAS